MNVEKEKVLKRYLTSYTKEKGPAYPNGVSTQSLGGKIPCKDSICKKTERDTGANKS